MFDSTSRYARCETAVMKGMDSGANGAEVRFVRRRFVPPAEGMTTLVEHTVNQGDRLDNVTARYVGDPTHFWLVCDANEAMDPRELETIGRVIRIAVSGL
jgi:hypothetical protein